MGAHEVEERAEAIRTRIEDALPGDLCDLLSRNGFGLAVSLAVSPTASLVFVDPNLPDQLAEEELDGFMVSLRKKRTGIDNTIFASTKGHGRHAPRIKIAVDPPDSLNEAVDGASMALHDFSTVGAYIPRDVLEQAKAFVELNRAALLDYWEARIDTETFMERLQPVPGRREGQGNDSGKPEGAATAAKERK